MNLVALPANLTAEVIRGLRRHNRDVAKILNETAQFVELAARGRRRLQPAHLDRLERATHSDWKHWALESVDTKAISTQQGALHNATLGLFKKADHERVDGHNSSARKNITRPGNPSKRSVMV